MTKNEVRQIFTSLSKSIPNPETELNYHSNFELLVAVILSAQATDNSVNQATPALFKAANTPKKMLALGLTHLKKYIRTIGLYNSKAKNIINLSNILINRFHSKVPNSREDLESLPGVGRKTANVILNILFNQPTIAVDTHVFRVANRIGLASGKTPIEIEQKLEQIIPARYKPVASHILLLHGRYVCKAKKPLCEQCVINHRCNYYNS